LQDVFVMRRIVALLPVVAMLAACIDRPQAPKRDAVGRPVSAALSARADLRKCHADLSGSRANFTPLPDQYFGAGCATVGTVRLSSLRSDDAQLQLSNLGPVACPLADTLAGWARFGVDRAARQILGSALARIETMGSFACRNVAGRERRSAHATANAIDVSALILADGRRISVKQGWSGDDAAVRRFLAVIHQSACKRFGTVLGPDYDAAHRDHLHVELSGTGFCR
jgi:hypothetical protein